MTDRDKLLTTAAEIADRHPDAAAILRRHAAPIQNPDPRKLRRDVLRWIWREHYFGTTR